MIRIYTLTPQGYLNCTEHTTPEEPIELESGALWIDLVNPDAEETRSVEAAYGLKIPSHDSIIEIEASSRFFKNGDNVHLRSYFLQESNHSIKGNARNLSVAFILTPKHLFTIREDELATFDALRYKGQSSPGMMLDPVSILLHLFETKVDRLADLLERLTEDLEELGEGVLLKEKHDLQEMLISVARNQDILDKTRLSLLDKKRALSFLARNGIKLDGFRDLLNEVIGDIDSLNLHAGFLFEKIEFLLDTSLGLINLEQNKIIKIFSIAAVLFLPPTLIASVYGMNFVSMPELHWSFGYPLSLLLMLASGSLVYFYFKKKGWL